MMLKRQPEVRKRMGMRARIAGGVPLGVVGGQLRNRTVSRNSDEVRITIMSRDLEEIASEALQMSVESRAALAKRLLDSLDDLAPQEYERMWVEEAARRYQQLKDGTAKSFASEDVFARLDARPRR